MPWWIRRRVGRQSGGEHKGARTIDEEPFQHRRPADERPHVRQRLTTGLENRQSLALQPEFCNQPCPAGTVKDSSRMRLICDYLSAVSIGKTKEVAQRRLVAIHTEDGFCNNQPDSGGIAVFSP